MRLTRRQMKTRRIAERVGSGVGFRAQFAFNVADGIVLATFFCAGAVLMRAHNACIDHGVLIVVQGIAPIYMN